MLHELPLSMHFKTPYQTFSSLVQEGSYRIVYTIVIPISRTVSYRHPGHDTQP